MYSCIVVAVFASLVFPTVFINADEVSEGPASTEVHSEPNISQSILNTIQNALNTGIPLFNDGDHAGCAAIYEQATNELKALELNELHAFLVVNSLEEAPQDPKDKAWHYRRTFDRLVADLNFTPLREAELPEGFPEHGPVGQVIEKQYPSYRMAMSTGRAAFGKLFRHIQRRGIPMTAPVEMAQADNGQSIMGFLYEDTAQGQLGEQDNITVVDIGETAVLSMILRGRRSNGVFDQVQTIITAYAAEKDIQISDDWRVLGYSSPMVPRERQYYEIQVSIETNEESGVENLDPEVGL